MASDGSTRRAARAPGKSEGATAPGPGEEGRQVRPDDGSGDGHGGDHDGDENRNGLAREPSGEQPEPTLEGVEGDPDACRAAGPERPADPVLDANAWRHAAAARGDACEAVDEWGGPDEAELAVEDAERARLRGLYQGALGALDGLEPRWLRESCVRLDAEVERLSVLHDEASGLTRTVLLMRDEAQRARNALGGILTGIERLHGEAS